MPRSECQQVTVFGKGGKTRAILRKPKTWHQLPPSAAPPARSIPYFATRRVAIWIFPGYHGSSMPPAERAAPGCGTPTRATP
jgi:hypothetical protein